MDIKEAIIHARQVAEGCGVDGRDCAYQHYKLADWLEELQAYRALGTVEELSALVKARDEGLLLKMPCKPGTELFGHCWIRGANPISSGYFYPPHIPKLGVDAWLTRAEAEAALGGGADGQI